MSKRISVNDWVKVKSNHWLVSVACTRTPVAPVGLLPTAVTPAQSWVSAPVMTSVVPSTATPGGRTGGRVTVSVTVTGADAAPRLSIAR